MLALAKQQGVKQSDVSQSHRKSRVYSAAMVSASFYVVSKDYSANLIRDVAALFSGNQVRTPLKANFPGTRIFVGLFTTLLLFSALLFAGATFAHLPSVNLPLDVDWLTGITIVIFIITVMSSYLVIVLDNSATSFGTDEISNRFKQGEQELETKFDAIRKS
ncbi:MAG: hypothetical protein HZB51_13450 [Chloroflexi bacterium]|nr:hypothetical protein [Chloroflexota bacterium]